MVRDLEVVVVRCYLSLLLSWKDCFRGIYIYIPTLKTTTATTTFMQGWREEYKKLFFLFFLLMANKSHSREGTCLFDTKNHHQFYIFKVKMESKNGYFYSLIINMIFFAYPALSISLSNHATLWETLFILYMKNIKPSCPTLSVTSYFCISFSVIGVPWKWFSYHCLIGHDRLVKLCRGYGKSNEFCWGAATLLSPAQRMDQKTRIKQTSKLKRCWWICLSACR